MTEESASTLHGSHTPPSGGAAAKSQYKSSKSKRNTSVQSSPPVKCRWCGKSEHPNGKSLDRINCTARNKKCLSCGIKGHLAAVCEKSNSNSATDSTDQEEAQTEPIPADASVSFSFSAQQDRDFRWDRKHEERP